MIHSILPPPATFIANFNGQVSDSHYKETKQERTKSITFLMPARGVNPSGGIKVVYEYANRLAEDGYKITILHPVTVDYTKYSLKQKLRVIPRFIVWMTTGVSGKRWFKLNKKIRSRLVLSLNYSQIPHSDIYIATAVQTAYYLKDYPIDINNKYYLIQGYENWNGYSSEYVDKSYGFGLHNIVISNWLNDKVKATGNSACLIKNGFDFKYFGLYKDIETRSPYSISMLFHPNKLKGCEYGVKALEIVKKKYPQLKVRFFGTVPRQNNLPDWIEYFQKPDRSTHNMIYNESSIYLAPSLSEGWGLTVGEAMICGDAIVCTDTLGFKEMVKDNVNGIMVPVANAVALANAIISFIENNDKRIRMAQRGHSYIRNFDWDKSYLKLRGLIENEE